MLLLKIAFILLIPFCNGNIENCQDFHAITFDNIFRVNEYLLTKGDFNVCLLVEVESNKVFKLSRNEIIEKKGKFFYRFRKVEITKYRISTK
jgi:hypothetical protein